MLYQRACAHKLVFAAGDDLTIRKFLTAGRWIFDYTKGSDRQCMSVRAFDILLDNGQATECCQIVANGNVQYRKALIFKGLRWNDVTPTRRINPKPKHFCLGFVIPRGKI